MKTDLAKILLDYESEEELNEVMRLRPEGIDINNHIRYSNLNVCFSLMANCNRNAAGMKSWIGGSAYTVQTIIELFKKRQERFDLDIDEGRVTVSDLDAQFMMVFNGKFGGERIMCNPLGIGNDGYMELIYHDGLVTTDFALKLFDGAQKGAVHFYDNNLIC